MRKNATIKIRGFYTCKVTNKVVTVQILASSPTGGWNALNTATGKKIHIKGPERLIKQVTGPKGKGIEKAPKATAKKKTATKKAVKKATSKKADSKKAQKASGNKMPLLDVAAKVLKTEAPLTCRQLIERMAKAGLWKSEAATPANTLHAALSKEIRVKGKEARFEKVDRGQFGPKVSR